ncbi:MAG: hypothetical protein HQL46_10755 [Gammaproteobacteria bacterium]|nr:hypothetical protein [Gammaproteobacteria bacterium]
MKFSDPFGRHHKKQESNYHSFRQSLMDAKIDNLEKTKKLVERTRKNMLISSLITIVIVFAAQMFFPKLAAIMYVFAGLFLLWLFTISLTSRRFIVRYIKEELQNNSK